MAGSLHAWGDTTPEGREREAVVDRLCEAAETAASASSAPRRPCKPATVSPRSCDAPGRGDRVFVVLSEKYLHSARRMFELYEFWFYSRRDETDFRRRVRVYALSDAQAATPLQRARLAAWWKTQHDEIAALIREHGVEILATRISNASRTWAPSTAACRTSWRPCSTRCSRAISRSWNAMDSPIRRWCDSGVPAERQMPVGKVI